MSVAAWLREMSRWPATSRSSRGADAGAVSRSTRPVSVTGRARLVRRRLGPLLLPVFAHEDDAEHDRADRHATVGHVERPEAHVAHADVDEVDDALRRTNTVEEIS